MRSLRNVAAIAGVALAGVIFPQADSIEEALRSITEAEIRAHLFFLSHDRLEGRAPGTRGGRLASLYIASQFERAGLGPAGGSHFQPVPLRGATLDRGRSSAVFRAGDREHRARLGDDVVPWLGPSPGAIADSLATDIVFVGYGITAPRYRWNDYEGSDVVGKIVLVLVGDPPAPPDEPGLFGGRALSYFGRWTYKLEEAARRGAAGVLLLHTTEGAGYGWDVVVASWSREQLALPRRPRDAAPPGLGAWIGRDFARALLADAGIPLEELFVRAARRDFAPIRTGIEARLVLSGEGRSLESANVVGLLRGSHPTRRNEVVIFTSHFDHLGIGPPVDGDSVYNGAYDNASGVAVLLELAEAFGRMDPAPERSILFLATTAEEAGLLGAEQYVRSPIIPLERTAAVINIDGANLWGETGDAVALGAERSTIGAVVRRAAAEMGMTVAADRAPERGFYYRSDHFPFARAGVPAIQLQHGLDYRGRPAGWGERTLQRYDRERYHRPSDRFDPAFDLSGAVQQARLAFRVGLATANAAGMPSWLDGGPPGRQDRTGGGAQSPVGR